MRSLAGCSWGAERATLHFKCKDAGTGIGELDSVWAMALRLCCGAFKTSPHPALLIEMGKTHFLSLRHTKIGLSWDFGDKNKNSPFLKTENGAGKHNK